VRSFAFQELETEGRLETVRTRQLEWFIQEVRRIAPLLKAGSDPHALDSLADDHANVRTAFTFAVREERGDHAADLTLGMVEFWLARGQLHEGVEFASRTLAVGLNLAPELQAQLHQTRAVLLETSGKLDEALVDWRKSVEIARTLDNSSLLATALGGFGTASEATGDYEIAADSYRSALELHRESGNDRGIAAALHYLASVETLRGNYEEARTYCTEAERIWRRLGELLRLAYSIQQSGILTFLSGDYEFALERYEEALALIETVGDQRGLGNALINIGSAQDMLGLFPQATATLTRARVCLAEMGDLGGVGYVDYLLGHVGRQVGDSMATARLTEARVRLLEAGDLASLALVHETLAGLAVDRGDRADAEEHFAHADRFRAETGAAIPGSRIDEVGRDRERLARL
jgi:tetratricopeptide (TPR) repeat protein